MIERQSWDTFRATGLVWWINRTLHLFGWSLVLVVNDEGTVVEAYPAHCSYRGFVGAVEAKGFKELTEYIANDLERIKKDSNGH